MGLQRTFPGEPAFLSVMGARWENCLTMIVSQKYLMLLMYFFLKYALTLVSVSSHITACSSTSLSLYLLLPLLVLHKTDFSRTFISSCQSSLFPTLYSFPMWSHLYICIYVLMILKFVSLVQVFSMSSRLSYLIRSSTSTHASLIFSSPSSKRISWSSPGTWSSSRLIYLIRSSTSALGYSIFICNTFKMELLIFPTKPVSPLVIFPFSANDISIHYLHNLGTWSLSLCHSPGSPCLLSH